MLAKNVHRILLGSLYGFVAICLVTLVVNERKFAGIENWPSVPARILESDDITIPSRTETRTGTQMGAMRVSSVTFEYEVGGQVFQSRLATPNGGGIQYAIVGPELRAFYNPARPEVGVLNPVEYRSSLQRLVLALGAAALLLQAWVSFTLRPARRIGRERVRQAPSDR